MVTCAAAVSKAKAGERTFSFVCSTDALDSHGEIVEQDWLLDRYKANPVCFLSHDSRDLPIGTASNVRVEGGCLQADITIVPDDCHEDAARVVAQLNARTLRAVSVGFRPTAVRFEKRDDREVCVLSKNVLYEISLVGLPSNPDTLMRLRQRAVAAAHAAPAAPTERSTGAALLSQVLMTEASKSSQELVLAAARLGLVATDEDRAKAAIVGRAEVLGAVCKSLGLPGEADAAAVTAKLAALSTEAARVPALVAERDALAAEKAARVQAECDEHVTAVLAAQPALASAKAALENFARTDFAAFAKAYPKPAADPRVKALTSVVVPQGGAPRQPSVNDVGIAEKAPGALHSDAAADLAERLIAKFPAKYSGADGYLEAITEASRSLKGA